MRPDIKQIRVSGNREPPSIETEDHKLTVPPTPEVLLSPPECPRVKWGGHRRR